MTAIGDLSEHGTDSSWPTINPVPLASFEFININTETKECFDEIVWLNKDQQIQASFVKVSKSAKQAYKPFSPGSLSLPLRWRLARTFPGKLPSGLGRTGSTATGSSSTCWL